MLSRKLSSYGDAATEASSAKRQRLKVAVIGGGLSGLACAKYLTDAGHEPTVYEARGVLGGKVAAWQDKDGDWIETGLHIFFGAYPNMMNLFKELEITDRLQWKDHKMTFAMRERPGEFTSFDFVPGVPAPFNMGLAILSNTEMLSLMDKLRMVPGLLPMLLEGQPFIDAQDELSVLEFMEKYGMPKNISDEIFVAMAKALDFIDPDKLSMTVILTAMNRFINEADGSQTAFLDGNQPDRLCAPMVRHIEARGGSVRTKTPIRSINVEPSSPSGAVKSLTLDDGAEVVADYYVSAMPVDVLKRLLPPAWAQGDPFFQQLKELEGIPVINLHLWFDRKLRSVDGLCFSRSPLLSVYADMSECCHEYADEERSMLELVFAPCSPEAGADRNWIACSDEEIVNAAMGELAKLFPLDIAPDPQWPATCADTDASAVAATTTTTTTTAKAVLRKHAVVRVPRSVYAALPGKGKFRPSQATPVPNFVLAGDFTSQKFLGSMEGAVLAGKLAAEVLADRAAGLEDRLGVKPPPSLSSSPSSSPPRTVTEPTGVRGNYPIAFGGGQQGVGATAVHP